jgi:ethanolamine-phosphate cytidylyltransferase
MKSNQSTFLQEYASTLTQIYADKYNTQEMKYVDIIGSEITGYTEGPFDLFHTGHLELFKKAKTFYDKLVVGVYTDETTKSYKRSPIIPYKDRLEMVKGCKYVDSVIEDAPLKTTLRFMKTNKLDYCIHGFSSWEALHRDYDELLTCGRVHLVTETDYHTTDIIKNISIRRGDPAYAGNCC